MLLGLITILLFLNNMESKKIKKEKLELACTSAVQMLLSSEDSRATGRRQYKRTIPWLSPASKPKQQLS
jgi:hypothetical protein